MARAFLFGKPALAGAAIAVNFLLLLSGCSAFFQANIFKSLDKVTAPTASDYEGPGGLDKLANDLSSPAIVAALKADPAAAASIETYLQTTYLSSPPLTTPDQQKAAVLSSDLYLKTTSGDQFVNNAVTLAIGGVGSSKTVKDIMQDIVPPDVAADPVAFSAMVEGLLDANDNYALFGGSLPPAPSGMNLGDVAQKAAIAWTVRSEMNTLETFLSLTDSAADRAAVEAQMFALLNNQPNSISSVTIPDPFSAPQGPPGWLDAIFTAAGATLPT
jgi:hypothetical protein